MTAPLLQIRDLKMHFPVKQELMEGLLGRPQKYLQAVDGVDLDIYPGEILGLVGESGCGKSTLARTILRLHEPTAGQIIFDGVDLCRLSPREMQAQRRQMQLIFQDPYASLNPRQTVEQIIGLPLALHGTPAKEIRGKVKELLRMVGLQESHIDRFPHQFSGGQRQRIVIARALAVEPRFIIADEAVSSLDVSIQAQIINLLLELQRDLGLTYLFITHDLSVVSYVSDRIAVMYLGQIVELAHTRDIFSQPLHPYTQALLSAIPRVDGHRGERIILEGHVPTPIDPPQGCRFRSRCFLPQRDKKCRETPPLRSMGGGHYVACHYGESQRYNKARRRGISA
ncbi:MAG: ABC transporter ATP-binding protein [Limnochordia bacterium]